MLLARQDEGERERERRRGEERERKRKRRNVKNIYFLHPHILIEALPIARLICCHNNVAIYAKLLVTHNIRLKLKHCNYQLFT